MDALLRLRRLPDDGHRDPDRRPRGRPLAAAHARRHRTSTRCATPRSPPTRRSDRDDRDEPGGPTAPEVRVRRAGVPDGDAVAALRRAWVEQRGRVRPGGDPGFEHGFATWWRARAVAPRGVGGGGARLPTSGGVGRLAGRRRGRGHARPGRAGGAVGLRRQPRRPGRRALGVPRRLLGAAVAHARDRGLARLVLRPSPAGAAFYRAAGFSPAGDDIVVLPDRGRTGRGEGADGHRRTAEGRGGAAPLGAHGGRSCGSATPSAGGSASARTATSPAPWSGRCAAPGCRWPSRTASARTRSSRRSAPPRPARRARPSTSRSASPSGSTPRRSPGRSTPSCPTVSRSSRSCAGGDRLARRPDRHQPAGEMELPGVRRRAARAGGRGVLGRRGRSSWSASPRTVPPGRASASPNWG